MRFLLSFTLAILFAPSAQAATLLFENPCPVIVNQAYLDGIERIKQAVRDGQRLHVYMQLPGTGFEYVTDIPVAMLQTQIIYGLLPERPYINGNAQVSYSNGIVGGSVDSQGHYRYAPWLFDYHGTIPQHPYPEAVQDDLNCYVIRWYGD